MPSATETAPPKRADCRNDRLDPNTIEPLTLAPVELETTMRTPTDIPLLQRTAERTLTCDPKRNASNSDVESPSRNMPLKDKLLPQTRWSSTLVPAAVLMFFPHTLTLEPNRATERTDMAEPKLLKSKQLIFAESRVI
jgi:hypothetical protein